VRYEAWISRQNVQILAAIGFKTCYNVIMTFGSGIPLRQFSKALRNDSVRHRIILDRVERNSVIEGLPRFTDSSKAECLKEMKKISK
jgi:hypothetical protein